MLHRPIALLLHDRLHMRPYCIADARAAVEHFIHRTARYTRKFCNFSNGYLHIHIHLIGNNILL